MKTIEEKLKQKKKIFINKPDTKVKEINKEIVYNFNCRNTKCSTSSNIQINEENLDCLIDTGAFTSFISEKYCKQRNFKREIITNRKNWVTANGGPIQVEGQVHLKIDKVEFQARFIVAKKIYLKI